jgi:hypothetical protein
MARYVQSHQDQMSTILSNFKRRCDGIKQVPVQALPDRIDYILASLQSNTQQQAVLAELCCCTLCIQVKLNGSNPQNQMCSICNRICCDICSHNDDKVLICKSRTCAAMHKRNKKQMPIESSSAEFEQICKELMCQWLVLAQKNEASLGTLRALYLIDAKNAALQAINATK